MAQYFVKMVLILVWFLIIPYGIGNLPVLQEQEESSFFSKTASGYLCMFAAFEILAVPMILAWLPFHILKYLYGALCILTAASMYIVRRKEILQRIKEIPMHLRAVPLSMWIALGLIVIQIAAYVLGMSTDEDDSLYVATATTTLHTDEMFSFGAYSGRAVSFLPYRYILSPFPILLAFFSDAIQMHAAVTAHTIEPVFFIMLAYTAYAAIGKQLLPKDKKAQGLFLAFVALITMFSYYSVYTQGTFLSIRIWQGKALLTAFILPGAFAQARICMLSEAGDKSQRWCWWKLFLMSLSGCLMSTMGMMLTPILIGLTALVYCIPKRNWRHLAYTVASVLPCICCAAAYVILN